MASFTRTLSSALSSSSSLLRSPHRTVPSALLSVHSHLKLRPARLQPCKCSSTGTEEVQEKPKLENTNGNVPECEPVADYPYEADGQEGGFFPTRDPGDFPSVELIKEEIPEAPEYDPLRDGPLRYLGYANELGEAFAAWLPVGGVPLSYAVAIGYVLVDTGDKGIKAYTKAGKELQGLGELHPEVNADGLTRLLAGERALDTVVWQLLASVAIPGATIHAVVAFVHYLLQAGIGLDNPETLAPAVLAAVTSIATAVNSDVETVAGLIEKSIPTFSGLIAIPFIVHPIDNTVHAILNVSMRPILRKALCKSGGGQLAGLAICDETCIVQDFPVLQEDKTIVDAFRQSLDEGDSE